MKLPGDIQSIALFRALQLGDWLCTIPAVRALRHALPSARITLLGLPWSQTLVTRFPHYFDDFVHFPGFPGLPEQPFAAAQTVAFLQAMQERRFDLLLQMQGNGNLTNPLLLLLGARTFAGFYRADNFRPNTDYFTPYPESGSEIHRFLHLMTFLGIPAQGDALEFPLTAADYTAYQQLALPVAPGAYVIIHPGARAEQRRWPPSYFAQLGDWCAEAGYDVVLTGVEAERPLTAAVKAALQAPAIDTTGQLTLGTLGVLVRAARLVICNDTGISHLAAALQKPSVVVACVPDERWRPLNQTLHRWVPVAADTDAAPVLAAIQEQMVR